MVWLIICLTVCRVCLALDLFQAIYLALSPFRIRNTRRNAPLNPIVPHSRAFFSFSNRFSYVNLKRSRVQSVVVDIFWVTHTHTHTLHVRGMKVDLTKNVKCSQPEPCVFTYFTRMNEAANSNLNLKYRLIPFSASWISGKWGPFYRLINALLFACFGAIQLYYQSAHAQHRRYSWVCA